MNALTFRRRKAARLSAPVADAPPVPAGRNAHGRPLVQDAVGVRPATGGEMAAPDYGSRIDVHRVLAEIDAQAEAEAAAFRRQHRQAAATARPPWTTAPQPAAPDLLAQEAHDWYGWNVTRMDMPPHHDRPYIPGVLGAEGRLTPRSAGVSDDLAGCLVFRDAVRRMTRPCCDRCQQASGTWQERLYGTYKHHTWAVPEAMPRQFGIATELRQAHERAAAAADLAERTFASQYPARRAA